MSTKAKTPRRAANTTRGSKRNREDSEQSVSSEASRRKLTNLDRPEVNGYANKLVKRTEVAATIRELEEAEKVRLQHGRILRANPCKLCAKLTCPTLDPVRFSPRRQTALLLSKRDITLTQNVANSNK